eukprot:TRINITY_DN121370_c0_g1_i1.p1 TRINITY_DN121370_c0_g1~~TRINITY_DN121370_c0_g1_i1.p1  ORF type:complete len:291 (-),score=54.90 TRINITY_DN121370_c0_g1_i1:184-1056(-)
MWSVFGRWEDAEFMKKMLLLLMHGWEPMQDLLIVDVGANIGSVSLYFAALLWELGFRRARILALEPEPESAALLRGGAAMNADAGGLVEVLEAAADAEQGARELHKFRSASAGSLVATPDAHDSGDPRVERGWLGAVADLPYDTFPVRAVALRDLLPGDQRIHFLKVDVEGQEFKVLMGLGPLLASVDMLVFEFRAWSATLTAMPDGPIALLALIVQAGLVLWCIGPCHDELVQVLGAHEPRPAFLGRMVAPADFQEFVTLSMRLEKTRRDFDMVAVSPGRVPLMAALMP